MNEIPDLIPDYKNRFNNHPLYKENIYNIFSFLSVEEQRILGQVNQGLKRDVNKYAGLQRNKNSVRR